MRHILIVEDEPGISSFVTKGLRRNGFQTAIASDGMEAIEQALTQDFDLLLLDLGLPQKDGWEVLSALSTAGRLPPVVIVVTARDDHQDQIRGIQFGVNDYVLKPFRFGDLLKRIQSHLVLQGLPCETSFAE